MQSISTNQTQVQVRVNEFIRSVYNWMAIGLALTGLVAFYIANTPALLELIFRNQILFFGLIIAELALVFVISARIQRMQASTATGLFILYSVLNGVTLSFIFLIYTRASIASTFFVCAATHHQPPRVRSVVYRGCCSRNCSTSASRRRSVCSWSSPIVSSFQVVSVASTRGCAEPRPKPPLAEIAARAAIAARVLHTPAEAART